MKQVLTLFFAFFLLSNQNLTAQKTNSYEYREVIRQALKFYQQKDFSKSLEKYEEAFQLTPANYIDLYNAACCASLTKDYDKAYAYLSKSIQKGYDDRQWLENDIDFEGFKGSKNWKKLIKSIDAKFAVITKDFKTVKKTATTDLVPFKENGNWGYLNRKNKKIAVPAKYKAVSFGGNCLQVTLPNNKIINVSQDRTISIYRPKRNTGFPPPPPAGLIYGYPKVDSSENFNGFSLNKKGRISHVSSKYDKTEWEWLDNSPSPEIEIFGPIKIKEKWYATVQLNGKWGAIDESGKTLEHLEFKFEELHAIEEFEGSETWFYFLDSLDKRGFISTKGEIRFYDEFNKYPFSNLDKMKLLLVNKDQQAGIIDLTTMKWKLEMSPTPISKIQYTYEGGCNQPLEDDRSKVKDFYFLTRDKDKNPYYIGEQNQVYRPKN